MTDQVLNRRTLICSTLLLTPWARAAQSTALDAEGVRMLLPTLPGGTVLRLGEQDPNRSATLQDNVWVGLKLLSYTDPKNPAQVVNQLHIDTTAFDTVGKSANQWRLLSEYTDVEGKSTGRYSKLVNWGAVQTTLRVDGYCSVDFAHLSVREITPP
jgi:hypothetical protein